jgi:HEPN domain-containing protein
MQRVKDWLKEAEAELNAAEDLFKTKHWAWCCFTCHQSAEKSLKAICEYFRTPQFGHNLNILLQTVKNLYRSRPNIGESLCFAKSLLYSNALSECV